MWIHTPWTAQYCMHWPSLYKSMTFRVSLGCVFFFQPSSHSELETERSYRRHVNNLALDFEGLSCELQVPFCVEFIWIRMVCCWPSTYHLLALGCLSPIRAIRTSSCASRSPQKLELASSNSVTLCVRFVESHFIMFHQIKLPTRTELSRWWSVMAYSGFLAGFNMSQNILRGSEVERQAKSKTLYNMKGFLRCASPYL